VPQTTIDAAFTSRVPRGIGLLASLAAMFLLAAMAPATGAAQGCRIEYWVSPNGSDGAAGDALRPFRTLERARDAVRLQRVRSPCALVVTLRGGDYRLTRTLVLDARDSGDAGRPVVWRAAPGERPVISGAVRVAGWAMHDPAKGILRAYVGPQRTRQLYVNGVRAVRAQTAPFPAEFERTTTGYRFISSGGTMPAWSNPSEIEAVALAQWKMMRCPVASISNGDIVMREPCWTNANVFQAAAGSVSLWNFRLVARFENALEMLDTPGEWYLDSTTGWLYYMPRPGEDMASASVELPVVETLIDGRGELGSPVAHIVFDGLTFAYATWLGPSSPDGYAADQSGFHLTGRGHPVNFIGHDPNVTRTPGNVRFIFARDITFRRSTFVHLGGAGLDFDTGSQSNAILDSTFEDISSAAIQVGGVLVQDHHPWHPDQVTRDNLISNNLVQRVGREFWDAAGIYIGFTTRTTVSHNDISDVPWSGIAIGWGWGLLDQGSFPGLPGATQGMWGQWDTPSTSRGNRILSNRIRNFLMEVWDGGAIYTQGAQGTGPYDGELIALNVAHGKRPHAGGNAFYTDGGSRFVTLSQNVSYDNVQGVTDFGPCGLPSALPWCALGSSSPVPGAFDRCSSLMLCWLAIPYGGDTGGCVPHGDLVFSDNYWGSNQFATVCPTNLTGPLTYFDNHLITGIFDVPTWILQQAGRQ
jgi:hypothetical protein